MENEETTLNTEPNDIAGNRVDGPVGNTAARPGAPGTGTGIPGGPPAPGRRAGPASGEVLADALESAGRGTVGADAPPRENQEANPVNLRPTASYGGNFSNSTQGSYRDADRRENQDSDPNRGEFGVQDQGGTTHGGFGNQNRRADYEPADSPEDRYYGGVGAPGPQDNAYRAYDGRDERPDPRTHYGIAPTAPGQHADPSSDAPFAHPGGDNRNQPDRADPGSAHQNDNGSAPGPDRGFAPDYGHTSLRGAATPDPTAARRNQTEDYLPNPAQTTGPANAPGEPDARGERPASSLGYGDRGREVPRRTPDFATGDERNGYVQANGGDTAQGLGSRGGSYNDAYDDSRPGSRAGSPAQGDLTREDTAANYGEAAREENRPADDDSRDDHGAPRRNAGRDGDGDE